LKVHLLYIIKDKKSKDSRNQGFSYYFCLMIGSIPLTRGSESRRPKNLRIRIRIRIRHNCYRVLVKVQKKKEEQDEEDHVEVEALKGSQLVPGQWVPAGQVPHEILTADPDALMPTGNLTLLFDFETMLSITSGVQRLETLEMVSDLFCLIQYIYRQNVFKCGIVGM
jgi:hypothetical protein